MSRRQKNWSRVPDGRLTVGRNVTVTCYVVLYSGKDVVPDAIVGLVTGFFGGFSSVS
jgi:hypothetical protein